MFYMLCIWGIVHIRLIFHLENSTATSQFLFELSCSANHELLGIELLFRKISRHRSRKTMMGLTVLGTSLFILELLGSMIRQEINDIFQHLIFLNQKHYFCNDYNG